MFAWTALILALILFCARARLLATECALLSTSSAALAELPEAGEEVCAAFQRIREGPERVTVALRTYALLCTLAGAPLGTLAGGCLLHEALFGPLRWPAQAPLELALALCLSCLATALVAFVLELAARSLAQANPLRLVLRRACRAECIARALSPFLRISTRIVHAFLRPLGIQVRLAPPRPPLEELERLLAEAAKGPELDGQAPRLIHNIFEMNDRIVRDIVVPRTQVVAIDVATPPREILPVLSEHGHSRMPVYRGEIDNIVGILHTRDLVPMLQCPELIVVEDALRPAFFVPWSKPLGDLLRVMQKKRIHMAIVVDEYGGFLGVATLEDLLETIVGEIRNEYTIDGPPEIEQLADGTFLIQGQAAIEDVEKRLGARFACDASCETMAGLVSFLSGCIPEVGERLFVAGHQLTIEARTARRVSLIRCQRVALSPDEERLRQKEGRRAAG